MIRGTALVNNAPSKANTNVIAGQGKGLPVVQELNNGENRGFVQDLISSVGSALGFETATPGNSGNDAPAEEPKWYQKWENWAMIAGGVILTTIMLVLAFRKPKIKRVKVRQTSRFKK